MKKELAIAVCVAVVVIVAVFGIVITEEGKQIGSVIVIVIVVIVTAAAVVVHSEQDCVVQWVFKRQGGWAMVPGLLRQSVCQQATMSRRRESGKMGDGMWWCRPSHGYYRGDERYHLTTADPD